MNVIIADDHALFREGMRYLLLEIDGIDDIHEARSAEEVLRLDRALEGGADLVLLDLDMPGINGVDGVRRLCGSLTTTAVVVISGNDAAPVIQACMAAGAMGFIPKSASSKVMQAAIRLVASGEPYLPSSMLEEQQDPLREPETLTSRQQEIWRLLAQGKSNKEMARELGVSEGTVKQHLVVLYRKLGVHSRFQAMKKLKPS
ncbi:MAG: DNA-binding response regulator [Gammaproteobacteria bacterium]|nr:MAG: DNA-binding response regulator [Gammaproteobacteria bacterium]